MGNTALIFELRQTLIDELRKPILKLITETIDELVVKNNIECKGFRYLGRAFYASNSLNGFVRLPVWKLEELKKEYIPRLEKILETEEKIKREESKLYLLLGLILSKSEIVQLIIIDLFHNLGNNNNHNPLILFSIDNYLFIFSDN